MRSPIAAATSLSPLLWLMKMSAIWHLPGITDPVSASSRGGCDSWVAGEYQGPRNGPTRPSKDYGRREERGRRPVFLRRQARFDITVAAAAGEPSVREHRQGQDLAAVRENHRHARALHRPEPDVAVFAAAGQPPVRRHRQGPDPGPIPAMREDHRLARTLLSRDSPDKSQTGINVRVFPALLQDRREVLTATSTSGNPNAWSRVWSGHFPWHLDALLLSVALECMTSNVSR